MAKPRKGESRGSEQASSPKAPPDDLSEASEPQNAWGIPDWLLVPLAGAAVTGLEFMSRNVVPPRLLPLAGKRVGRLTDAQTDAIYSALGTHERFTATVLEMFSDIHSDCLEATAGVTVEEIWEDIEVGIEEPDHAVSLLVALDRLDDARNLASLVEEEDEPRREFLEMLESFVEERAEDRKEIARLEKELAADRRARKRAERREESNKKSASEARAKAKQAEEAAAEAEERLEEALRRVEELEGHLRERGTELESGRRERRDLLGELEVLQNRFVRLRRQVRELRALQPAAPPPEPKIRPPKPPPSLEELNRALSQGGTKAVLDRKGLLVVVDGWNVGLGQIAADRLEDKRRLLEQALERYQSRTGNQVLVVYDGREVSWFWVPTAVRRSVLRLFTPEGETADDYIVSELEESNGDRTPVVVTSDRELRERCIALGAFVISSSRLAETLSL